ncbi:patatin-like phospholipase family protein [Azospirillum thermophilum]|uniref:PNPLA domain-containing protein n=1 Tax=Azospirillum thermophilum TaxID=2202148 RepID=A0A2S2CSK5_9PROT|nr:patatin-like phospholipase family protein [Azospirillum thermophilum]AWK87494.1 hypothetical protein DEW08_15840 [Azospirillum thermophilum]
MNETALDVPRPGLKTKDAGSTAAYGIFQGGGAKGVAHLGAWAAAVESGVEFVGVAGSSAGALVAALIAVGYTPREVFDYEQVDKNIVTGSGRQLVDLVGLAEWKAFVKVRQALESGSRRRLALLALRFALTWILPPAWPRWLMSEKLFRRNMKSQRGVATTDIIKAFCNDLLLAKLGLPPGSKLVTFADIRPASDNEFIPLKITATNVLKQRLEIFDEATEDVVVADALAASISVPFFFAPTRIRRGDGSLIDGEYVDGGLLANLPIWLFREEKLTSRREFDYLGDGDRFLPVFAFSLTDGVTPPMTIPDKPDKPARRKPEAKPFVAYAKSVVNTGIFGSQRLSEQFMNDVFPIEVPANVDSMNFSLNRTDVRELVMTAKKQVGIHIEHAMLKHRNIVHILAELLPAVQRQLDGLYRTPGDAEFDARRRRIRLFVFVPHGRFSLCVRACYSEDGDDSDDQLIVDRRCAGVGDAYRIRIPTLINIKEHMRERKARFTTKYERALVPDFVETTLSIPLFKVLADWDKDSEERRQPVGVFVLDADFDLGVAYRSDSFVPFLIRETAAVTRALDKSEPAA